MTLDDSLLTAIIEQEQFSSLRDEFSNEVELLTKIDHRNLVKLLGYSEKGNERIIITEYVPNGTLREHLDGKCSIQMLVSLNFVSCEDLTLVLISIVRSAWEDSGF